MVPVQTFCSWYQGADESETGIAKDAFEAAKGLFNRSSSLSDKEKHLVEAATRIEDVQKAVAESLAKYEAKNASCKARKWLQRASETICHYGNILDVFVQHHPEYVSLVWGTMKLLFTSVVNHSETLKLLAKNIYQVALRLPRVKILSILYPTEQMRLAVESLYSCILEFLLMAYGWCNESKFQHIYHSFTRPHELRYNDLLERITDYSNNLMELATVGSQAEIRVMHRTQAKKLEDVVTMLEASEKNRKDQIDGVARAVSRLEILGREHGEKLDIVLSLLEGSGLTIKDLLEKIETFHSIQTSAQLNTNQQLSELQLSQVLATFNLTFEDPNKCYEHHALFRRRRAAGMGVNVSTNEFWLSPSLTKFSSSSESTMVIIKGSFTSRVTMQDFGVDVIQALARARIPTIWALADGGKSRSNSLRSATDIMKYLAYQVLRLRGTIATEKQMALRYSQFHTSQTAREWLGLFKQVVVNLNRQLYIIVDLATVQPSVDTTDGANFVQELSRMLSELSNTTGTKVKAVMLVYEASWFKFISGGVSRYSITVKTTARKRQQGKAMRHVVKKHFT
ncbi:hypothetical protein F5Y13DRAFT_45773 [Hypoxylon sp. FL1857]|nr:hypothetical protein F5Y13DRAFT_45773 [Hypoxylon sp. FL1857]